MRFCTTVGNNHYQLIQLVRLVVEKSYRPIVTDGVGHPPSFACLFVSMAI